MPYNRVRNIGFDIDRVRTPPLGPIDHTRKQMQTKVETKMAAPGTGVWDEENPDVTRVENKNYSTIIYHRKQNNIASGVNTV